MSKGRSGGGMRGFGGLDLGALQRQAQEMQAKMMEAQQALEKETVTVSAGGGAISIVMTGHQKIQEIKISPEVLQDVEMLQDLILAAVNEAVEKSQALANERMGAITGGLGLPGM